MLAGTRWWQMQPPCQGIRPLDVRPHEKTFSAVLRADLDVVLHAGEFVFHGRVVCTKRAAEGAPGAPDAEKDPGSARPVPG